MSWSSKKLSSSCHRGSIATEAARHSRKGDKQRRAIIDHFADSELSYSETNHEMYPAMNRVNVAAVISDFHGFTTTAVNI
jgi:hypothetical protein